MRAADTMARTNGTQRECVARRDLTDCLLEAYDFVARRAYQKFVDRGAEPGGEMDDWLSAEHEVLGRISVDLCEAEEYVSAIASLPGFRGEDVEVGIEARWLVIIGCRSEEEELRREEISEAISAQRSAEDRASGSAPARSRKKKASEFAAKAFSARDTDTRAVAVQTLEGAENQENSPSEVFTLIELPAAVDPEGSTAVLSNGLLGIRMPKAKAEQSESPRRFPER